MSDNQGSIRVGIGGWVYPPWRGTFYPARLPQAQELAYASRQLTAIEIMAPSTIRGDRKAFANGMARRRRILSFR